MMAILKLRQLERKLEKTQKSKNLITWHDISEDGRLLDENGYIMTDEEVSKVRAEDARAVDRGATIWCMTSPQEIKLKQNSSKLIYKDLVALT